MRLTGLFLLLALVACATVAWAGQGDEPGRISVDVTNGNVHDILSMIAKQAGLNLAIDAKVTGTVTVALRDVTPDEALRVVASAAGARVRQDGEVYVVEPKPLPAERPRTPSLATAGATVVAPTAAAPVTGAGTSATVDSGDEQVIRVIKLKYADPAMIADAFGGGAVGSGTATLGGSPFGQRGGYGGYGGGYGGYGGYGGGYGGYGGYGGGYGGNGGGYGGYGGYGGGRRTHGGGYGGRLGTFGYNGY